MGRAMRAVLAGVAWALCLLIGAVAYAQLNAPETFAGLAGGSANALTLTVPNVNSLADLVGVPIRFFPSASNTGASVTISVNGLTPTAISKGTPSGGKTTLTPGDLVTGQLYVAVLVSASGPFHVDIPAGAGFESANTLFAGPTSGNAAAAAFRTIATADLNSTAGQYPGTGTNDSASAGNIGEYISSSVPNANGISLNSATPADITSITLTPGNWLVWGSVVHLPAGGTTLTAAFGWTNTQSAVEPALPNNGALLEWSGSTAGSVVVGAGQQRIAVASGGNQTVYLTADSVYTGGAGSVKGYGFIGALRIR